MKVVLVTAVSLGLLVGCSSSNSSLQESGAKESNNQLSEIVISSQLVVADNLDEMKEKAQYIVVGKYTKLKEKINSSRDVNDPRKESKEEYSEGEVYEFAVEKVLKGFFSGKNILVNIPKTGRIVDPESNKKYQIINVNYIKPKLSQKYILFLDKMEGLDSIYSIPFFPYALEVQNNNTVNIAKPDTDPKSLTFRIPEKQLQVEIEDTFGESYKDLISGKNLQDVVDTIEKKK